MPRIGTARFENFVEGKEATLGPRRVSVPVLAVARKTADACGLAAALPADCCVDRRSSFVFRWAMREIPTWCAQPHRAVRRRHNRILRRWRPPATRGGTDEYARGRDDEIVRWCRRGGGVWGCGAYKDAHEAPVSERNSAWPGGAARPQHSALPPAHRCRHEASRAHSPLQQTRISFSLIP